MSGLVSNKPLVSAGGVSSPDISATYSTLPVQTGDVTITGTKSVAVPVDSTGGTFTITLNDSVPINTRARIHDSYLQCGTNPVIVNSGASTEIGRLNTDGGAIEFAWSGASWLLIDRFENLLDRDEITGDVQLRESNDTLVAGAIRTGTNPVSTAGPSDYTNAGSNVDQQANDWGNAFNPTAEPFNDTGEGGLGYNTNATTPYTLTGTFVSPERAFNGSTTGISTNIATSSLPATIGIETGASRTITHYRVYNRTDIPDSEPDDFQLQGYNGTSWDTIDSRTVPADGTLYTVQSPSSYENYRLNVVSIVSGTTCWITEIELYEGNSATTNNTFDTTLVSGSSGQFVPSTLAIRDENNALINGTGKVNVGYAVDGGAFGGASETWYAYTIPQNQPSHTFFEHFKVTAGEAFTVMVRKQTNGGDGTELAHYGSSAEDASSDVEIQQLIDDALDDYTGAGGSGDALTGTVDIVTAEAIASQDDAGTQTVHIYVANDSAQRVALSGTFEIVVSTNNAVVVEANYCSQATDTGGETFSATNPTSSGTVSIGGGAGGLQDLETFRALGNIAFSTQFNLRLQPVGSQRISTLSMSQPATRALMTSDGMEVEVDGQVISKLTSTAMLAPSGEFGQSGVISDQSVADGEFTNAGANVDQGAGDWGNNISNVDVSSALDFSSVTTGTPNFTASGGTSWTSTHYNTLLSNGFAVTPGYTSIGVTNPNFVLDLGSAKNLAKFGFKPLNGGGISYSNTDGDRIKIEGGSSPTGPWTTLWTPNTGRVTLNSGVEFTADLDVTGSYRYVQFTSEGNMAIAPMQLYEVQSSSTDNTFDTNLATGTSGTFTPNSFKAYDENNALISGSGKVNVAYAVDGGAFIGGLTEYPSNFNSAEYTTNSTVRTYFMQASVLGVVGETITRISVVTGGGASNVAYILATPNGGNWDLEILDTETGVAFTDGVAREYTLTTPTLISAGSLIGVSFSTAVEKYKSGNGGYYSTTEYTTNQTNIALVDVSSSFAYGISVKTGDDADQTAFTALGNLAYTSQFDLRLQPVGAQRISRVTLSTPNQTQAIGSDGSTEYKKDGIAYAKMSVNGLALPSLTTAERDAVSTPDAGLTIFNSTTNKLNFYNGTAWEAITSA